MVSTRQSCLSICTLCLLSAVIPLVCQKDCSPDEFSLSSALAFLEGQAVEAEQDLVELAAIPSISSMDEYHKHVLEAGKWVIRRLKRAGLKVTYHPLCLLSLRCIHGCGVAFDACAFR